MSFGRDKKQVDLTLKPAALARQAYIKAIRLLGTREHTTTELRKKLGDSGFESETIEELLVKLIKLGYQSDDRFASLYAESLLRKNYGPMVISSKLVARGIESSHAREAIQAAMRERGVDWSIVASDALLSKFSMSKLFDSDQESAQAFKGKCARYLNRRGFSSTDSIKAIRLAAETVPE